MMKMQDYAIISHIEDFTTTITYKNNTQDQ